MDYSINQLIILNLLGIIGSIFLFYIVLQAFHTLGSNQHPAKWKKTGAVIFCFLITMSVSLLNNTLLNLLSFSILMPCLGYFFYNRQKSHIIYYLLLCIGILIADCIASVSYSFLLQSGIVYFNQEFYDLVFYVVFIRLLEFIAVTVLSRVFMRKMTGDANLIPFLFTLLFPIFSLFFIYSLIYMLQVYPGSVQLTLFLTNTVLLFGLNLFFSYVFETFLKNNIYFL